MEKAAYSVLGEAVSRVIEGNERKFIDVDEDLRFEPGDTVLDLQNGTAKLSNVVRELDRAGYVLVVRRNPEEI